MHHRPSWTEYFLSIAELVAQRSTCHSRQVGAVIAKNNNVLSTGYNAVPAGIQHPLHCARRALNIPSGEQLELCNDLHAEENAVILAAKRGVAIEGATLYCTNCPCKHCCLMIINAGIREVVYKNEYQDVRGLELLEEAHITVIHYNSEDGKHNEP